MWIMTSARHPHALQTTPPLLDHLSTSPHQHPRTGAAGTADEAHAALRLLHRTVRLTCGTCAAPESRRPLLRG